MLISTILSAIILLAIVGFFMYQNKNKSTYPPTLTECPDYYSLNDKGLCVSNGTYTIIDSSCNYIDFSSNMYKLPGSGKNSGICNKKKKAQECKITWDGLTNNYTIC
jgi:hypothetical protein